MTLFESIALEFDNGSIGKQFNIKALLSSSREVAHAGEVKYRVGFDFFNKSTIQTYIPNNAIDELTGKLGKHVQNGLPPKFRRVAVGTYQIIGVGEDEELDGVGLEDVQEDNPITICDDPVFEDRFACYLINIPFQIFDKRRRFLHPAIPAQGFGQRLASYFWPKPTVNFTQTNLTLNGFIARAAAILGSNFVGSQNAIVTLFQDICAWGGVQFPRTATGATIIANVRAAGLMKAENPAAMNSAWTKLYAIFYPNDYVIYDSRVATAIIHIAESVMNNAELAMFKTTYPSLGVVNGRGGTRPRGMKTHWNHAYASWLAQFEANILVKKVLLSLQRSVPTATLRELEAVLFMEGY